MSENGVLRFITFIPFASRLPLIETVDNRAHIVGNQSEGSKDNRGIVFWGQVTYYHRKKGHHFSRDPFRPIRKQQTICLCEPQTLRSRGDRVSLCVREPQTAPQSPRMGDHIFEKNRVLNKTSNGGSYPQNLFPDPSHGEGEVMTSPEVT